MSEEANLIELNDTIELHGLKATCCGIYRFEPPLDHQIGFLFDRPEGKRKPENADLILSKSQLQIMLNNGLVIQHIFEQDGT